MAKHRTASLPPEQRIVITGVGLTSPLGDTLADYRANLLAGKNGVSEYDIRYFGKTLAGLCHFEETKHQKRKEVRRGTRAGSIGIFCAHEAIADAGIDWDATDRRNVGVYIGITEHGNVETENEIYQIKQFDYDCNVWSHHHNPRTVANNPAGEICLNLGITGPHYTIGAACAAGNAGLIQGMHMLRLGECDLALAGGVSESVLTFGIFAAFNSQGALAKNDDPAKASRPFDKDRNGIVVAEGGCVYTLERLSDATARGAKIYGELVGHAINTDATDFVLPNAQRQAECIHMALDRAGLEPEDINIVNTHATATVSGDIQECAALREIWGTGGGKTRINNTKSFFGHAMGAAGVLELAGNLPSFEDSMCHATINLDNLDPECDVPGLVTNDPVELDSVDYILNNSFGMLGINSVLIIGRVE
jgi:3-oxoacyl-[acyl-carrier-protein] synthase II